MVAARNTSKGQNWTNVQSVEGPVGYTVVPSGPSEVPVATSETQPRTLSWRGAVITTLGVPFGYIGVASWPSGVWAQRKKPTPWNRSEVLIGSTVHQSGGLLTYSVAEQEGRTTNREYSHTVPSHSVHYTQGG